METDEILKQTKHTTWNKTYLLDIEMIDKQHMLFFKSFDRLLDLNNQTDVQEKLGKEISELEKFTHNHFGTEEALMRKANASEYELHLIQHKVFISKMEDFKVAYNYNNSVLMEQMINFMRKWFLIHISEIDKKYVESVKTFLTER